MPRDNNVSVEFCAIDCEGIICFKKVREMWGIKFHQKTKTSRSKEFYFSDSSLGARGAEYGVQGAGDAVWNVDLLSRTKSVSVGHTRFTLGIGFI